MLNVISDFNYDTLSVMTNPLHFSGMSSTYTEPLSRIRIVKRIKSDSGTYCFSSDTTL